LIIQLRANEPMTVSEAVIQAGWTDFSKHTVKLLRHETDPQGKDVIKTYHVDVDAVINNAQKDQDIILKPGDTIYVDWSIFANR
jgi:protein involved in polysaccharide export with SLBB domain